MVYVDHYNCVSLHYTTGTVVHRKYVPGNTRHHHEPNISYIVFIRSVVDSTEYVDSAFLLPLVISLFRNATLSNIFTPAMAISMWLPT